MSRPVGDAAGVLRGAEIPAVTRAALAELDRLLAARPELQPLGPRVSALLSAAFGEPGTATPDLAGDAEATGFLVGRIREGWSEGVPAVRVVAPSLDREVLIRRLGAINATAGTDHAAAVALGALLESDPGRPASWATAMLTEEPGAILEAISPSGIDPDYIASVLRLGLLGELGEWSGRVCAHLGDGDWSRGGCPVCGSEPSLAEARGLEQRRFLRCGLCGAGWPGARGRCGFCGQSDARSLRYLMAEEDGDRYRLILCDACGGRLKVVATLAPLSPPGLLVAELATLHLDFLADGPPSPEALAKAARNPT